MLKILQNGERIESPCVLVLGGFDGLHLGHRALLNRAQQTELPVAITTILGGKGASLFTKEEREFLFLRAGIGFAIEFFYTSEFQNLPAEEFCKELFLRANAKKLICGEDFRFGKGALGTPALLKALAPCPLETVPPVCSDYLSAAGEGFQKISTSACKEHLKKGEIALLNACLETKDFYGSAYFVQGEVEHGREEGRKYGFPTANLSAPAGKLLPPDGVYGGLAATEKGNFPAIVNFGARPTFGVAERKIEAHLIGFSGDLYKETVRVYPIEFLRGIEKFSSPEALKIQLEKDKERVCK